MIARGPSEAPTEPAALAVRGNSPSPRRRRRGRRTSSPRQTPCRAWNDCKTAIGRVRKDRRLIRLVVVLAERRRRSRRRRLVVDVRPAAVDQMSRVTDSHSACASGTRLPHAADLVQQGGSEVISSSTRKREPRAVAQLGSALDWGSSGRRFKSCQPDRENPLRPGSEGIFRFGKRPRLTASVPRVCQRAECCPRTARGRHRPVAGGSAHGSFGASNLFHADLSGSLQASSATVLTARRNVWLSPRCKSRLARSGAPSGGGIRRPVAGSVSELCCCTGKLSCGANCRSSLFLRLGIAAVVVACQRRSVSGTAGYGARDRGKPLVRHRWRCRFL